jgi:tRNA(Ile)-lysidine synthase
MLKVVEKQIQSLHIIKKNGRIIVGVSGGADSIALLHILYSLGYECIAAHCNFYLRGNESYRDEQFAGQFAKYYDIPFKKIDFDTENFAAKHKISIEMAARNLRYEWFESLRKEYGAQAVAVAHHADDNIETLLINLTRGTGLKGMTGMPARNGYVIRPLLCNTRNDIFNYLKCNGLSFVEDSTNSDTVFVRNRFRHEIIPALEKINPSVRKVLHQTVLRFTEIEKFYREKIEDIKKQIVGVNAAESLQSPEKAVTVDIKQLLSHKNYKPVLYEILSDYGFGAGDIDKIENCMLKKTGQIFYSEKHKLLHNRDLLVIAQKNNSERKTFFIHENDCEITEPFYMLIKKHDFTDDFEIKRAKKTALFDAGKLTFPLEIRRWQTGDSFTPFGMKGRKKLSDFLIDEKISRFDKENIHILLSGNNVAWVMGLRISENFKITAGTKKIVEMVIK